MRLFRVGLAIIVCLGFCLGSSAAQYNYQKPPAPPKVVTADQMPLACFSIRLTNLYPYTGFSDTHYGQNFVTHVLPVGQGYTPMGKLTLVNNEAKFVGGFVFNSTFFRGDQNLIEIGIEKPDINHPDNHGRLRVELGPNLEFTDAASARDITENIDYDNPLRHHLRLVAGIDCDAVAKVSSNKGLPANQNNPNGPIARILSNQQVISNASTSLVAGVLEPIRGDCEPGKDGSPIENFKWRFSDTLTGGFEGSITAGSVKKLATENISFDLYGAFPGTQPTLTLTCTNRKGLTGSADAHFEISGPVMKQVAVQPKIGQYPVIDVQGGISPVVISRRHITPEDKTYDPWMGPFGLHRPDAHNTYIAPVGVLLRANPDSLPRGSELAWIQVIQVSDEQLTSKDGTVHMCSQAPGGDTVAPTDPPTYRYPYSTGSNMDDSPGIKLDNSRYSRMERHFYAESYLMWRASNKDTYVPVAVARWQYEGAAVVDNNALRTDPFPQKLREFNKPLGWSLVSGSTNTMEIMKPATALEDFPHWVHAVGPMSCKPAF